MVATVENKWPASMISSPGMAFSAITPSDTVDEAKGAFRGIYVGSIAGGAAIVVVGLDNVAVTFSGVVAGSILPLIGRRVNSTNTTASSLVAIR
jgi:hypothetical protein